MKKEKKKVCHKCLNSLDHDTDKVGCDCECECHLEEQGFHIIETFNNDEK